MKSLTRTALAGCFAFVALSVAALPAEALICGPVVTPCRTTTRYEDCGIPIPLVHTSATRGHKPAPLQLPGGTCVCTIDTITYQPAGTACTDDANACTTDVCNGTGTCTHAAATGLACTADANPCTTDVCDATASCTHNNATGGSACNNMCIAPGTCCANPNSCGGGRTCSGNGGTCGCPAGQFDCAGTCISTATCCNAPNSCAGGKTCSAIGGTCACPAGKYDCGGTCVANATCCNAPDNCPPPSGGNGTSSCGSPGGSCVLACAATFKACGASCIPQAQCCVDTDCPNDAPHHRHGVCGGGGVCSYGCDKDLADPSNPATNFKACGTTCITIAACCTSAECTTAPNGCYKTQGACSMGSCTYSYNDGASCNADNDACTPNDKCQSGTCVADTANAVTCIRRECHSAPTCNKTTGNCDDTVATGACGGDGCSTSTGTCSTGTCSVPSKDCTASNGVCKVGVCDPAQPFGGSCTATNKLNGLACTLADKCLLATACNGGDCVGTPKLCTPSAVCRVALCNSSTGSCEEALAPVGTSCVAAGACVQNAACDASGNCVGDIVPDGNPCEKAGCSGTASCVTGMCICIDRPDFGGDPVPIVPTDVRDMAAGTGDDSNGKGCSFAATPRTGASDNALCALLLLVVASALTMRRRRA